MTKMKLVPHSEKVSFAEWGWDEALETEMAEAVQNGLVDFSPYVDLAGFWKDSDGIGGPPVDDVLTLDVCLPVFSKRADTGPVFRISFREIVLDLTEMDFAEYYSCAEEVSTALKSLATEIDDRLAKRKTKKVENA